MSLEYWQIEGAWIAFSLTYVALAIGYVPWFRLDRAGAAFIGSVVMVCLGVLTPKQAFLAQDQDTLLLLFSMIFTVANPERVRGFLHALELLNVRANHGPCYILEALPDAVTLEAVGNLSGDMGAPSPTFCGHHLLSSLQARNPDIQSYLPLHRLYEQCSFDSANQSRC